MDVQSVTEVIAAFRELGGEAKDAFVWYLVVAYLPAYVIGMVWTIGGLIAIHKTIRVVASSMSSGRLLESYGGSIIWLESELTDACKILRDARRRK